MYKIQRIITCNFNLLKTMGPKRKSSSNDVAAPAKKSKTAVKQTVKKGKETAKAVKATAGQGGDGTISSLKLADMLTDKGWKSLLSDEFDQPYFKDIEKQLESEYKAGKEIFPHKELIFNAFNLTPLDKVKVVILGQDPYHDNGQAMGLSFSVPKDIKTPPSLKNIYKELDRDPKIPGFTDPGHGDLTKWAENGILLLNATLTVEAHKANSHAKFGWQKFTDSVIKTISNQDKRVAFILWGGFAHKKEKLIEQPKHSVIKTAHPSPLSASKFKECNCFSDCNDGLKSIGQKPMDWSL